MKKIFAAGPVIVSEGRLLVVYDGKDDFFKIPGGKPEAGESLEECVHRELGEETGYQCHILRKLSTKYLSKKPQTGEEIDIELHHYRARLLDDVKSYEPFYHNNHHVHWLDIKGIKSGKYEVAQNVLFLIDKKDF